MAWSCITYVASMPAGIQTTLWLSPMRRIWPSRQSHTAGAVIRYPVSIFGSTRGQAHGSAEHATQPTSEPIANAKLPRGDMLYHASPILIVMLTSFRIALSPRNGGCLGLAVPSQ